MSYYRWRQRRIPRPGISHCLRQSEMNTCPFLPCLGQSQIPWVGITYCLGQSETNTYFFSPCLIDYQIGTHVGAQKHTPPARLSSTPTPFAGRLVGRMQYAPTFPEKDKVSLGMCFLLSRTMADKYVFHFSMSNRLSDRYPCRGVLHTPHKHPARDEWIDLESENVHLFSLGMIGVSML